MSRGRSFSNRHVFGGEGPEERTTAQAEVNMANSKLLGDTVSPTPVAIPPPGEDQEGHEAETSWVWARLAKEVQNCWSAHSW